MYSTKIFRNIIAVSHILDMQLKRLVKLKVNRMMQNMFIKRNIAKMGKVFNSLWEREYALIKRLTTSEMLRNGIISPELENEMAELMFNHATFEFDPLFHKLINRAGKNMAREIASVVNKPLSFDGRNARVLGFVEKEGLLLAKELSQKQIQMLRDIVAYGIDNGYGQAKMARMIRGTVGITSKQHYRFVRPLEERLNAQVVSGTLTQTQADSLVFKRIEKIKRRREKLIARMETNNAYHKGNNEAMFQARDDGIIAAGWKIWSTSLDGRVRDDHANMEGEKVPIDSTFSNGSEFPDDFWERCVLLYELEV